MTNMPALSSLLSNKKPEPGARERSLESVRKYYEAQAELERICKEKGIPVPVMEC